MCFRQLRRELYKDLKFGILIAVGYFLFRYAGQFTQMQSCLLGFLAATLIIIAKEVDRSPRFEPFRIQVEPRWHRIIADNGLADDNKWKELCKGVKRQSVLRRGINLTAVTNELFFSNDHKTFFSKLVFVEAIKELLPSTENLYGVVQFTPRFTMQQHFVKHPKLGSLRCIKFGLVTAESVEKGHHADGTDVITLATLPFALFNDYYRGNGYVALDQKINEIDLKSLLAEYGWKEQEHNITDWWDGTFEISHRNLIVRHRGV